jgi:5'-nucleotidase
MSSSTRRVVALAVVAVLAVAGCSSSSDNGSATTTVAPAGTNAPSTEAKATPLRILVTNDDGVGADGIDAVVEGLRALPDVEVTVVAPATNQSGSASNTTDGPLTVTDATTKSGYPAKAVEGFPADTIIWALDQGGIDFTPDLVVSGINAGQNIGPLAEVSGTVGAARAAVKRNVPALAASQGLGTPIDFPSGVRFVTDWVTAQRATLLSAPAQGSELLVASLNIPTCTTGTVRGQVEVQTAADAAGRELGAAPDCTATAPAPATDVEAFLDGFAALAPVGPAP